MAEPTDPARSDDDGLDASDIADDAAMDRRLRGGADELRRSLSPAAADAAHAPATAEVIPLDESRRRIRRARLLTAVAVTLVVATTASAVTYGITHRKVVQSASGAGDHGSGDLDAFLDDLPDRPVDPHKVKLSAAIASFDSCDALLDRLRRVGAEHVGSRGFGYGGYLPMTGYAVGDSFARSDSVQAAATGAGPTVLGTTRSNPTLGTNIQVAGVDEPDVVKAVGQLVYSVRDNRLRITDVTSRRVVSVTDLDRGDGKRRAAGVATLLVSGHVAVLFGSETVQSEPVAGDRSAATSSTEYVTVTQYDVTDPAAPALRNRSRLEGRLVDARLVGDQVRMVTGSSMSDIGFVSPTTPASIPVALETNRRTLAASSIADWIPEWDSGGAAKPIADCHDVFVPDTFAGVSMTSMVNFAADGSFVPHAATVLAPSDVVYATATTVVVAAGVWVDPVERDASFTDWASAVHRFDVSSPTPHYVASGQVQGSIGTQFNFGEVGDALAVVSSKGSPWSPQGSVALTTFRTDGTTLRAAGRLDDLGGGLPGVSGVLGVNGVRFTGTRLFVSGQSALVDRLVVVDLHDPNAPRRSSVVTLGGGASYIHPVSDERVVTLGTRSLVNVSAAHAELVDTADPASPRVLGTWDVPFSSTNAAYDHHAFLAWPEAKWMAFASQFQPRNLRDVAPLPEATFVSTEPGLRPEAGVRPRRVDVAAPCPTVDLAPYRAMLGTLAAATVAMRCDGSRAPDFPGRSCSAAPVPGAPPLATTTTTPSTPTVFLCQRALVADVVRVLVVDGSPWLYTTESLESLDATSFASSGAVPLG